MPTCTVYVVEAIYLYLEHCNSIIYAGVDETAAYDAVCNTQHPYNRFRITIWVDGQKQSSVELTQKECLQRKETTSCLP